MAGIALYLVDKAITVLTVLIIVRAIMSWVPDLSRKYPDFMRLLDRITDPVIRPFRRVLSRYNTGGLDLSPVLAIIALGVVQGLINRLWWGPVWRP